MNAEVGVGYAKQAQKPAVPVKPKTAPVARLAVTFTWNFSETASFEQTLYVFVTSDNNFWESVSKVRTTLTGALGLARELHGQAEQRCTAGHRQDRYPDRDQPGLRFLGAEKPLISGFSGVEMAPPVS